MEKTNKHGARCHPVEIRRLREKAGLTMVQCAAETGYHYSSWQRCERAKGNPRTILASWLRLKIELQQKEKEIQYLKELIDAKAKAAGLGLLEEGE